MSEAIRVKVTDLATGETETQEVAAGDYLLICTEPCHLTHTRVYGNTGTHVLTVKGRRERLASP